MNTKGQVGVGAIILATAALLIGLAIWTGSFAQNVGELTQTSAVGNTTFALPAAGSTSELSHCEQRVVAARVSNVTGQQVVTASNYTISQSVGTNGYLVAKITSNGGVWAGGNVNISCTYEPYGYIAESSSRSIVTLIAIFMALLILVAAVPNIRNGVLDFIKG